MDRIKETVRDPKWIAIGLTVLVLVVGCLKFLATLGTEDTPDTKLPEQSTAVRDIDVEPGSYEILTTSWSGTGGADAAAGAAAHGAGDDPAIESEPARSPEEAEFYKKAHKTWNGICIARQSN